MKQLFIILLVVLSQSSGSLFAQAPKPAHEELQWYTDLVAANEQSRLTKKPVFAFFTGSDWCGWCMKLQNEVFSKKAFVKWAKEKVILLELDFPRKTQLAPELAQQNNGLQQAFQVQGFPTVWMFFAEQDKTTNKLNITPLGSCGYPQGAEAGHEEVKFLADANAILAKIPK
jgi:protein disulfide-isomerase